MKESQMGAVKVSLDDLHKFLGLTENERIVRVFEDLSDVANRRVSIVIEGSDYPLIGAGSAFPFVTRNVTDGEVVIS